MTGENFSFLKKKKLFIYLFGCIRSQLWHAGYLLPHVGSSLWHVGSSSLTGWNLGPLHWEHGVLTTGPPGKSLERIFLKFHIISQFSQCKICIFVVERIQMLIFQDKTKSRLKNSLVWSMNLVSHRVVLVTIQ